MSTKPGAALPQKAPQDQIKELERLAAYLSAACDGYHEAGDREMGVAMGETARRIRGLAGAIRFRIDLAAACCHKRARGWACECGGGMP